MQFTSPERALRWAYEITNRPIVKISSINSMRGADRSADEFTVHDKHAQAALILSLCERVLSSLHFAYVRVQFGREAQGFELLAHHLAAHFGTGLHSRRGIELMIRGYCGERVGLREIQHATRIGFLKSVSYRNRAYDVLDVLHAQSMDVLRGEMEVCGLREARA